MIDRFTHSFVTRIITAMAVACLPLVTALCFHLPRIALDNFTDAVFYLSYARQFSELVLRNGFLYYATRFGGILPDALSGHLFGEITGIWVLRWILAAAVSAALFLSFRKRYGLLSGLLASVLWSFNPAALRLICTTYVDSTSVPFLILGCCLVIGDVGIIGSFLAGILFGMASSAHLYAAFALVFLTPWMIGSHWANRGGLIRVTIWAFAGFLLTWFLGWLWYAWIWRMPSLLSPTIDLMRDLGGGQAAQWKKKLPDALHDAPAWFAPLCLIPVLLIATVRGSPMMRGAALSLLGSALFFWGGDLFGSAYVLSMPFYYSFLLPVTVLSSATLGGEILRNTRERSLKFFVAMLFGSAAALPVLFRMDWLTPENIMGAVAVISLAALVAGGEPWERAMRALVGISLMLGASFVASAGMFSQMLGHYPDRDIPVLELAAELKKEIPPASSDGRSVRFWYDDDPSKPVGADRRMIESFWQHTFAKLIGRGDAFVPFLSLNDWDQASIARTGSDRIVVFDQDSAKVKAAVNLILEKSLPYAISKELMLVAPSDPSRKLAVAILVRKQTPAISEKIVIDLHQFEEIHRGSVRWDRDVAFLESGKNKWLDFARLPLGPLQKGDRVVVFLSVLSGNLRCSLNGHKGSLSDHFEKWPAQEEQEVVFSIVSDVPDAYLSFHSMYPNGSRSSAMIRKVEVERPHP